MTKQAAFSGAVHAVPLPVSDEAKVKRLLVWMVGIALIVGSLLSIIVPPMKSPDEADHLRRAYLLTKGQWLLSSGACTTPSRDCQKGRLMSGGEVDTGLNDYLVLRDFQNASEFRVNEVDEQQASVIRWSRQEAFSSTPGTGYYFPLIYTPQAIGLALGKALDLSIQTSYYLTRFVSLLASLLILALAFWIWQPPAVVLALLVLPMSIFQVESASLDGFSNALTVLALSCFLRFVHQRDRGG